MRAKRLLTLATVAFAVTTIPAAERSPCKEVLTALDTLESGSFEGRWRMLDDPFPGLGDDADSACREKATATVFRLLHGEPDDRIVARIMDAINWTSDSAPQGLLVEALRHRSPNIRRRAAGALTTVEVDGAVPQLEALWRSENRDWVLASVARALGHAGDRSVLDNLNALAVGNREALAGASLKALLELRDARSVSTLEALAASVDDWRRDSAIHALVSWRDLPGTDEALLHLTDESVPEVATRIVMALAARGREAVDLLIRIERRAMSDAVRTAAAEGIDTVLHPWAHDTFSTNCSLTVSGASRALPLLFSAGDDRESYGDFTVRKSPDFATLRCWDGPGVVNPEHVYPRALAGDFLYARNLFEWNGELWYVGFLEEDYCWLPASSLVEMDDEDDEEEPDATGIWELDLAVDDLSSLAFRHAERIGFASVFDETPDVVGVRLQPPNGDREWIMAILRVREEAYGDLRKGIDDWLDTNEDTLTKDPKIAERLAEDDD